VAAPPEPITPPIFNADYLDNPPPPYPMSARRSGQQGRVVLRVLVTPAGTAEEVEVRDSSGHVRLDEAARDTVRHWRFVPAKRGAQPIPAWVLIPISFRLKG
jgi:protein TonB